VAQGEERRAPPPKVTRPEAANAIARERLFARLDEARGRAIVWIGAPAGFGKTTLAATYLEARRLPAIWYAVDRRDDDAAGFFHYFGLAVERAFPEAPRELPRPIPEALGSLAVFARRYFEALFETLPRPCLLVLEDFHETAEGSPVHEVLREASAELQGGVTLIVLSRRDVPAALARTRAGGRIAVLDEADLRFTRAETAKVVRRVLKGARPRGPSIGEAAAAIHETTGGWAAGVVLLVERVRETGRLPDPGTRATGDPAIFDYFASEVLARLDAPERDFLFRVAVVPSPTGPLAAAATGEPRAGDLLDRFARHHLFLRCHGGTPPAYELEPLFRAFLVNRARRRFTETEWAELHRRASLALVEHGRPEEALDLAREGAAFDLLADLLEKLAPELVAQARHATLEGWLARLPEDRVAADPWLLYWRGICALAGEPHAALPLLERAIDGFRARGDAAGAYTAWCDSVAVVYLAGRSFRRFDERLAALEALRRDLPDVPAALAPAVDALRFFGLIFRRPAGAEIERWQDRAARFVLEPGGDVARRTVVGAYFALFAALQRGEIARAEQFIDSLSEEAGRALPLSRIALRGSEAMVAWLRGDDDRVARAVADGLDVADRAGLPRILPFFPRAGAFLVAICRGDRDAAGLFVEEAAVLGRAPNLDVAGFYQFIASWWALVRGDIAAADHHYRRMRALSSRLGKVVVRAVHALGGALIRFEAGDRRGARALLGRLLRLARRDGEKLAEHALCVAEADFDLRERGAEAARPALERAFALGRQRGFLRFPWFRRDAVARLCAAALDLGIEAAHARSLIEKNDLRLDPRGPDVEAWPFPVRIYTLGGFRLERRGRAVDLRGKARTRPLDLLKALVALGGGERVPAERLADALWPEADAAAAHHALANVAYRLREWLDEPDLIATDQGQIVLDRGRCFVDAWAFERVAERLDGRLAAATAAGGGDSGGGGGEAEDAEVARLAGRLFALYRGPFLPEAELQPWSAGARERLRARFRALVSRLGAALEKAGRAHDAAACYARALAADDGAEAFHAGLARCRLAAGPGEEASPRPRSPEARS